MRNPKAKPLSQGRSEQRRLVEASLTKPLSMERHGDDQVYSLSCLSVHSLFQKLRKGRDPVKPPPEFQPVNAVPHDSFMESRGSGGVEWITGEFTIAAQMIGRGRTLEKRPAATGTKRSADPWETPKAVWAPVCFR